ncbi:MAG TPA: gfo/Idh/MocA family oxidoreductase [Clostridiales bacterium]|nr:Gfo/Idh/MocA family oxidoreductase [Clostridia bacterium]HCS73697.1 gfo/Idh/MocA family oxidoreductase [Clostridiales bacterium]
MEKIKMAIVGAGTWGLNHARIYHDHPFAETVAVCDTDTSKANKLAAQFGVKQVYTDYREMAAKSGCDAVAIVTPDYLHADIAIACANEKKHVLIEKPLATTYDDVHNIIDAVEKNNVRAMVDLHNRWNPPFNVAKQAIDNGDLGEPYSAYFRLNDIKWVATDLLPWASKSSILWFLGSHSLDTLRWLTGSDVESVYSVSREGVLKSLGVDTVDMYLTTLEFKNGCIAQMENGWITPNGNTNVNDMKCSILGTKGQISIDTSSHNVIQKVTDERATTPDILVNHYVDGAPKGFAYESIRHFVDRLIDGRKFSVSLEDAANTSLAILAIFESAKQRKPIEVKY